MDLAIVCSLEETVLGRSNSGSFHSAAITCGRINITTAFSTEEIIPGYSGIA